MQCSHSLFVHFQPRKGFSYCLKLFLARLLLQIFNNTLPIILLKNVWITYRFMQLFNLSWLQLILCQQIFILSWFQFIHSQQIIIFSKCSMQTMICSVSLTNQEMSNMLDRKCQVNDSLPLWLTMLQTCLFDSLHPDFNWIHSIFLFWDLQSKIIIKCFT